MGLANSLPKAEEMLQRRAEVKEKNEQLRERQMRMQQQDVNSLSIEGDVNNLFVQQGRMTHYAPRPR